MNFFFSSLGIFNFCFVRLFFSATEIKKTAEVAVPAVEKYQFTFNGTSVFSESGEKEEKSGKKIHSKPSKHFSCC